MRKLVSVAFTLCSMSAAVAAQEKPVPGAEREPVATPQPPDDRTDATSQPALRSVSRSVPLAGSGSVSQPAVEQLAFTRQAFVANRGQFDVPTKFALVGPRISARFRADGIDFATTVSNASPECTASGIAESFVGGSATAAIVPDARQPGYFSFFLDNVPAHWRSALPGFTYLTYKQVWPGIDLHFYGRGNDLEQEVIAAPDADISKVRFSYRGIRQLRIAQDGSLEIETDCGELRENRPYVYQVIGGAQHIVSARFQMVALDTYTFVLGPYDHRYPLIIDPTVTLAFSQYFNAQLNAVAVDSSGNVYVAGKGTVNKFDKSGTSIWNLFFGDTNQGGHNGIAVDSSQNVYVTGTTFMPGSIPFVNGFQSACSAVTGNPFNCVGTAYLSQLKADGTGFLYSTYLGGGGLSGTEGLGVAADNSGNAYITGDFIGSDFPVTSNAFSMINTFAVCGSPQVPFVTRVDTTKTGTASLIYSTYINNHGCFSGGASLNNIGTGIATDGQGNAYVTGETRATNFPTTQGAYQASNAGNPGSRDVFVLKLDTNQSGAASLLYSTYIGGSSDDIGQAIAIDGSGNAYVTGSTSSGNFPTLLPIQATRGGGTSATVTNAFVTKLNSTGTQLVWSTYLGGGGGDVGYGIAIDGLQNVYVTGSTLSSDFPVANAFQSKYGGTTNTFGATFGDAFVTKVYAAGTQWVYSTYLGGSGDDQGSGIAVDSAGSAFVVGRTNSSNFPTVPTATNPRPGFLIGFGSKIANFAPAPTSLIVTPNYSANDSFVTVAIRSGDGNPFPLGATVKLSRSGQDIPGAFVQLNANGYLLNAAFLLAGQTTGAWDVVVTPPTGSQTALAGGFTVQTPTPPQLQIAIVGRAEMVPGVDSTYDVYVTNLSNSEAVAPTIGITVPPGVTIKPQRSIVSWPVPDDPNPPALIPTLWPTPDGGTFIQPTIPYIAPGDTAVIPITLNVPSGPPVKIPITAEVTNPGLVPPSSPIADPVTAPPPPPPPPPVTPEDKLRQFLTLMWSNKAIRQCFLDNVQVVVAVVEFPIPVGCIGNILEPLADKELVEMIDKNLGTNETNAQVWANGEQTTMSATQIMFECAGMAIPVLGKFLDAAKLGISIGKTITDCSQVAKAVKTLTKGTSEDPNDKAGPDGAGPLKYFSGTGNAPYALFFTNEPTATAPAHKVVVTDQLDVTKMDLSTFELGPIYVGNQYVLPPQGALQYSTILDLRSTTNVEVNINAGLNLSTGIVSWTFTSIDPLTGQPTTDPTAGFLPPDTLPPNGEGGVAFNVKLKPGLRTGDTINNQAVIVFDTNPPINTPIWTNTIDNTPPVSHVSTLAATSTCPNFQVSWSGSDVGSGLQGFTIYVSDTGAPFTTWLSSTTATAAIYTGASGHTYYFYSVASDLAGNAENQKTSGESTTAVTAAGPCGPPSLSGKVLSSFRSGTTVTVSLQLTNTGFTAAQALNINQITFRTLSGSGTVTLASPVLPAAEGPLAVGANTTVTLTLNVPATVTRFSLTEGGSLQDGTGHTYNYSIGQTVIP